MKSMESAKKESLESVEIVNEIKTFSFFKEFGPKYLSQVSEMMRPLNFKKDSFILEQGQINDKLYFLREGLIDVLFDNEKVSVIKEKGEVFGEMSALRARPTNARLIARSDVKVFEMDNERIEKLSFGDKQSLQNLLFRIYTLVLMERLDKTNEKAKNFEIAARELEKAKKDLELISSAKINFLAKELEKTHPRKILMLEGNKKNQNLAKMAMGGTGVELILSDNIKEGLEKLKKENFDLIFAEVEWIENLRGYENRTVFVSPLECPVEYYSLLSSAKYLISRDPEQRDFSIKSYLISLLKILNQDFFGIEKHLLSFGVEIKERIVIKSDERESCAEEVLSYFSSLGIRKVLLDQCQVVIEELLMNAIYDAPINEKGESLYNHLPRGTPIELPPEKAALLRYACDGITVAISVVDFFGGLKQEIILKYLESCYKDQAGKMNAQKGGAGRGLHQIVESSDLTIFNVEKNKKTEVICVWNIENLIEKKEWTPSFHFFFK